MIGGGDGAPGAGTESRLRMLTLPARSAALPVMLPTGTRSCFRPGKPM